MKIKIVLYAFAVPMIMFSSTAFAIKGPMNIQLDSKVWNYYSPGALKPGGLLPITKNDGVITKNIGSNENRIVYLVREAPLTTTVQEYCKLNQGFSSTESIEVNPKSCFVLGKESGGSRSYQLVFSNIRKLKLVTIATNVPTRQHQEVLKDYLTFKKGILK